MPDTTDDASSANTLRLRGVRVHNLQGIDLDLPLGRLIVITGVSGAGKSSLAFDTLYAEGQRRYVECFSTYSRQFLERLEPPQADEIGPLPPAIAVRQHTGIGSRRATVGSVAEVLDHLRLLLARRGTAVCPDCRIPARRHSPASAAAELTQLPEGTRFQVGFPLLVSTEPDSESIALAPDVAVAMLQRQGWNRVVVEGQEVLLSGAHSAPLPGDGEWIVIIDRLQAGRVPLERLTDSLEAALQQGHGTSIVLIAALDPPTAEPSSVTPKIIEVEGKRWQLRRFSERLLCECCGREFADPEPALFSFNSPLGACPVCRGTGLAESSALRGKTTSGRRNAEESSRLSGSLPEECPACHGARLRPEALLVQLGDSNIADLVEETPATLAATLRAWEGTLGVDERLIAAPILPAIYSRLAYLQEVGLGYLTLGRAANTLSRGELQRARLAGAFGAGLVGLLFVLDEPTTGLHASEVPQLLLALKRLRDAGNTVIVVEHELSIVRAADYLVDLGPGSGREGGRILYQGPPAGIVDCEGSATGAWLAEEGQQKPGTPKPAVARRLRTPEEWIRLSSISHHNLRDVAIEFPLGVLCAVTGVSGSGKSSLVVDVLLPAVTQHLRPAAVAPQDSCGPQYFAEFPESPVISEVVYLDQSALSRSPRSHPASLLGVSSEIRALFVQTGEARVRNLAARQFSFTGAGSGRCESCEGTGVIAVDMQFLPDVTVTCEDCRGTRFRRDILDVKFRGLSIAEVLALSTQEGFTFFRGQPRIQRRLKLLKDVGLAHLQLGQPVNTLSGGESQRLKLAASLAKSRKTRTLFILDEPTTGLHPQNVAALSDSWEHLLNSGHSLIVIEHHLEVIRSADWVIDLGPGSGNEGGRVVFAGRPEGLRCCAESVTGKWLRETFR